MLLLFTGFLGYVGYHGYQASDRTLGILVMKQGKPNSNTVLPRSEDSNKRPPGTPGTPGSRDLEAALRRLSLRRDNYLSEKRFFEEERERKLAYLAKEDEKGGVGSSGGAGTPTESLFSLCSHPSLGSVWSGYAFATRSYLPEKLQIVKPLEGETSSHKNTLHNNPTCQKHRQNDMKTSDWVFLCSPPIQSDKPTQTIQNQHQNRYLIFHNCSSSRIFMSASRTPRTPQASSSLLESSSLLSSQVHLRGPLALITGLLEVLGQQGGTLNLQHSFYFRHTRPRCWFEL